MKISIFYAILILSLLTPGCANKKPKKALLGTGSNKRLESFKIASDDGFFESKTLAYSEPIVQTLGNSYYIQVPLGPEKMMECYLYNQRFDSAQGILKFNRQLDLVSKKNGFLPPLAAGAHVDIFKQGGSFSTDHILFRKNNPNDFINAKSISVSFDTETLMCTVHFPKLQRSFKELITVLLENMKVHKRQFPLQKFPYESIYEISAQNKNFGWTQYYEGRESGPDKNGNPALQKFVSLTASLGRGNPVTFVGHDWITSEWAEPDGTLVDGMYIYMRNEEVIFNLKLHQVEVGQYEVKGTYYNKEVEFKFSSPRLKHHAFVQNYLKKNKKAVKQHAFFYQQFIPHLAPNKTFEAKLELKKESSQAGLVFRAKVQNVNTDYYYLSENHEREYLIESNIHRHKISQKPVTSSVVGAL